MKKIMSCVLVLFSVFAYPALAHEGHDHDAPTTLKAPKGGVIKALDEANVEVVSRGQNLKVYFYDNELKPLPVQRFKLTSQAERPRIKKSDAVTLVAKEGFYEGTYDAKGAHRYTLRLEIEDQQVKEKYTLTFTIEPRR